ncbi:MAG: hypothetical protein LBC31_06915 [Treponema sp.]|jgi:hypothetical protein|nr:hypothetical protein [Treponema sp.]
MSEEQNNGGKQPAAKQPAAWKATCDCTYNGEYVAAGEIVYADKMDNPHFEKAGV